MKTRFILIQTSHAGNVGAVARAMRTMGFDDLVLVAPRWPDVLHMPEAIERASGATEVLAAARVVPRLEDALDGVQHLCATAMVARDFGPPTCTPRTHFTQLMAQARAGEAGLPSVAFLFGSERYGMRNEDVYRCHVALQIPSDPAFGSLNLAAAVQVIAYEWRLCLDALGLAPYAPQGDAGGVANAQSDADTPADAATVAAMLAHWRQGLEAIGYLDPQAPKKLMPRLQQLFNRARPTPQEIHILRGIAKSMLYTAQQARKGDGA